VKATNTKGTSKAERRELSKLLDAKWSNTQSCYSGSFALRPTPKKIKPRTRK
jgi:hypothetical protein